MMPKGVEHVQAMLQRKNMEDVKIPMMPKGVEHMKVMSGIELARQVKIPMMPKGVEHKTYGNFGSLIPQ